MTPRKVTVLLDPRTLAALRRLAIAERRDVPMQARVLLERTLRDLDPTPDGPRLMTAERAA